MPTRNPDRHSDEHADHHDHDDSAKDVVRSDEQEDRHIAPNPPRTTTGKVTAPKFGSAGSGGAELEPGPERD
jgi:hypothetical protein